MLASEQRKRKEIESDDGASDIALEGGDEKSFRFDRSSESTSPNSAAWQLGAQWYLSVASIL
jgi:hypothetical protein